MVAILTLAPFSIYWSDYLSERSLSLSRQVGFDIWAFMYALSCALAFIAAYLLLILQSPKAIPMTQARYRLRKGAMLVATFSVFFLSAIGIGVTLGTVSVGGSDYVSVVIDRLMTGQSATDLLYSPQGFMLSESVSGIIRMLGGLSNAAVIVWLALAIPSWRATIRKLYWPVLGLLLFINFARSAIGGDRAPALYGFLLAVYVFFVQRGSSEPKLLKDKKTLPFFPRRFGKILMLLVLVSTGLLAFNALDRLRGAEGYNTVLLYADLGVANLSLAMQTGQGLTYGFSTFLAPLHAVFRVLHIPVSIPEFDTEYILTPPSNLLAYSYWDFGVLGFIDYMILGLVSAWVQIRLSLHPEKIIWRVAHLYVIYALATAFSVPIFSGHLYWAGLLASLVIARYLDTYAGRASIATSQKADAPKALKPFELPRKVT